MWPRSIRWRLIKSTPEERDAVLPFEGFVEGGATLSVALAKPRDFRLEATFDTVQINAKPSQALRLGVQPQDVVVKNTKPVEIAITSKEARITAAQFTARETSLEVSGGIPFDVKASADLAVRGSVNLAILQLLNRDLLARGNATVQASLRGSLTNPQLNGRMELKDASLYLADLPNGVDNAQRLGYFRSESRHHREADGGNRRRDGRTRWICRVQFGAGISLTSSGANCAAAI